MATTLDVLARRLQFLAVLRNRKYRVYYSGLLTSVAGYQMMTATQAWLVYRLTGSVFTLGLVGGLQAVPGFALTLFAGALADRANMRYIIILGQMTCALVIGVLATLVVTGLVQVWHIVVSAVLIGVADTLDQPSRRAVWPHLVPRDQFVYAVSLNSMVWSSTRVVAPSVAGFIIATTGQFVGDEQIGAGFSYYVTFLGFLAMALAMGLVRLPQIRRAGGATVVHDIIQGLSFTFRHRVFLVILGIGFTNGFFGLSYMWLMPVFAEDYLHVDVRGYGFLVAANGVGGVIGTLVAASFGQHQSRAWVLIGSAVAFGAMVVLFAVTSAVLPSFAVALTMVMLGGGFWAVHQVASEGVLNLLVPDEFRGRVLGLRGLTWSLAPMGSLVAGAVAAIANTPLAVALGGAMVVASAMVALASTPEVRHLGPALEAAKARVSGQGTTRPL